MNNLPCCYSVFLSDAVSGFIHKAGSPGFIFLTGHLLQSANCYLCRMKILMVCLGNICRSPLAEGILKMKAASAGLDWTISSAGTNGFHTGEPPHELSSKVALLNGIDISKQRARKFIKADMLEYDRIYSMATDVTYDIRRIAAEQFDPGKVDLLLNATYPGQNRDVPDPWYGPEPGYHEVFELISKACDAIIENHLIKQTEKI
jgi:protein-tyrosine phosphatase